MKKEFTEIYLRESEILYNLLPQRKITWLEVAESAISIENKLKFLNGFCNLSQKEKHAISIDLYLILIGLILKNRNPNHELYVDLKCFIIINKKYLNYEMSLDALETQRNILEDKYKDILDNKITSEYFNFILGILYCDETDEFMHCEIINDCINGNFDVKYSFANDIFEDVNNYLKAL